MCQMGKAFGINRISTNEAIGGVPNKFMTTALTSWAGNHNHTVSLTVSGGHHNQGGATGNSGSNETRPKNEPCYIS